MACLRAARTPGAGGAAARSRGPHRRGESLAVSDRGTKVLMERLYQNLARGLTTAEAMNTARMSRRREAVPARFRPAFSVIGGGAVMLTLNP